MLNADEDDTFTQSNVPNFKTNNVYYALINPQEILTGCVGLIGRFLKPSSRRNQCIISGYHYDGDHIKSLLIKNTNGSTITEPWKDLYETFKELEHHQKQMS